jgi:lysophospholipase L1-like esterase
MDAHFVDAAGHEKAGVFVDGVHLTKAGYEIWYETMEPLFAKLLL